MNPPLSISDEIVKLEIEPKVGGSFLTFSTRIDDRWVAIMRSTPADFKTSSDTASFLMAPYPNRVRDGTFTFEGRSYSLRFPEKHAIHGDVRNRPWQVETCGAHRATLRFRSEDFPDINYPFPFSVTQSFEITDGRLLVQCTIRNEGSGSMPAGCGYHPYFNRALTEESENVSLRFKTEGIYPSVGDIPLPTGMARPLLPLEDFSNLRPLDVELDACFAGWDGNAEMVWPASKVSVAMNAGPALSHLVLFSPPGKPYFALEPQSQMTDGFNFFARGERETGVTVLPPGGELAVWFSLTVTKLA
jgi:aldose 1-epimerase